MRWTTLIRIAWRSLRRNRRRTLITVSAIAFSIALCLFFLAFARGSYEQMINDATRIYAGHLTLEHPDYRDAPAIDLVVRDVEARRRALEQLPNVRGTKVLIQGQGVVKSGAGASGVGLIGVEPAVEVATSPLAEAIVDGSYLEPSDENKIVIGTSLAERLDVEVGKKLVITANDASGDLVEHLVRVKGIFRLGVEEVDGYVVNLPLVFLQKVYGLDGGVTQIGVLLDDPDVRAAVMASARTMVEGDAVAVRTWEEVLPDLAAGIRIDHSSNVVFQTILIALSLFTIFNTILMSVLERTREFAVQLALGTPSRVIMGQVMIESALIAVLGCFFGLGLGWGIAAWGHAVGMDMTAIYGEEMSFSGFAMDPVIYPSVHAWMLINLGLAVFGATITLSLIPMRRIARIRTADVLRA